MVIACTRENRTFEKSSENRIICEYNGIQEEGKYCESDPKSPHGRTNITRTHRHVDAGFLIGSYRLSILYGKLPTSNVRHVSAVIC
jgi:hypothetical protein